MKKRSGISERFDFQNPGIVTIKKLCDGLEITLTEFFDTDMFRTLEQEIQ